MTSADAYHPSQIKRSRATKSQVNARREALAEILADGNPMTVRQVFYQATVHGIIEKTEAGYAKVQTDLTIMRRSGVIPYHWLADNTRWQRRPKTYDSINDALDETARLYRKRLWREVWADVEIWLEKDALSGVVSPVTFAYDVPLMVTRGYASLSFLHGAAEEIKERNWPTYIYHLGDFDPSGVNAGQKIEETLRDLSGGAEIYFERIGVTPEQISNWSLPSRPTKQSDTRAKNFGEISVELDAIPPDTLRAIVKEAIERHLPQDQYAVLKAAEESEREHFIEIAKLLKGAAE